MGHCDTTCTTDFELAPRRSPPAFTTDEIDVAPPPVLAGPARNSLLIRVLPVVMAVATAGMMAAAFGSRTAVTRNPMFLAFPAMMLISVVVTALAGRDGRRSAELDRDRADYLSYLSALRASVTKAAAGQYSSLIWCHPDPESLWTLIGGPRMWERRPGDADFGQVRIGTGIRPLAGRLVPPDRPPDRVDPVTASALHNFLEVHSTIASAPVSIGLRGAPAVTIDGDPACARALVRAMICQLAVLHSPEQLLIAAAIGDTNRRHWEWLKWLPHFQHPGTSDEAGPSRMRYQTLTELEAALGDLHGQPLVVAVVDGDIDSCPATAGLTVLKVGAGGEDAGQVILRVSATEVRVREADRNDVAARPDQLDAIDALVCARRLSAYRLDPSNRDSAQAGGPCWHHLLGIDDVFVFDPPDRWRMLHYGDRLRVPIGTTVDGAPVELDIKEAAEHGMGPHGLCIGATGSGKSELLRTVALGMLARHSPEVLNLVLIDFKGGATFLGLERAPHVAAVITNLCDEAPLVARMSDALAGEINRRQQILRRAGTFVSANAYEHARRAGAKWPALPALFIIVDEYSELLRQHPDFAETFAAIGRLGRSLGMHLLLASQRLDEGRLRGLESHLSYRICLKTLSANESRVVLGKPDAFELPSSPGVGFLQTASAESIRFQTAFVSGRCPPGTVHDETGDDTGMPVVRVFTAAPTGPVTAPNTDRVDDVSPRTVLEAVVDVLARCGPAAHPVWLPPLEAAPGLDSVLREAGLVVGEAASSDLAVPIGVVDRPYEQQRTLLTVDLSAAAGNVAVVGAPQSGKSTSLRTLITALAATHDPGRVQFYCLDFGGGALESARCLPHVGSVAGRAQPDLVTRTVAELESLIRRRDALFRERGIESMARYRQLRTPQMTADRFGDVFLVVDGWANMRRQFPALEESIIAIAAQGLSFGVHLVISASRWADIRPGLKDQLGTRIELRLGDPADSEVDRKQAQRVPKDRPGRGLTPDGLHMVIALPRLDGVTSSAGLAEAAVQLGQMLRRRYGESVAAPVPLLPARVEHHVVLQRAGDELDAHILLGLEERESRACPCDLEQHQHLLILGDNQCGKTAALRTLCREITRTKTAGQARLVIVDFRRSLLGVVESDHLAGYAVSTPALERLLTELLTVLQRRMPPPQATQQQLRTRSWWRGPDLYLVVDDYDLVANAAGNPLAAIVEYLPYAADLGLHLLVARRSGGAARAMFEPLLAGLRELGCMGLMMSADPEEGALIGSVRPTPLPAGRGTLVTRGCAQRVQVSWSPPP
jgi:S-DNA-T family DNA segregation ATPase FtsK/SpoIIIE